MSRRRAGVQGLQQHQRTKEQYGRMGAELQQQQLDQLKGQLEVFRTNLEEFASKYKKDIRKDPAFRSHFQRMCTNIGVDPLASNKGFWSELLGVGDFYFELGVQIVEVCMATRERTGGLMDISEVKTLVTKMRGKTAQEISEFGVLFFRERVPLHRTDIVRRDDIARSIASLRVLGGGFEVVNVGSRRMVQSVPRELNSDYSAVLDLAQTSGGYVSVVAVASKLKWIEDRATHVLDALLKDGVCWIDLQASPPEYWVSGFVRASSS